MTNQKGKGYQGIGETDEAFEYQNTRSDFKCCNYRENWKTMSDYCYKYIRAFSDNVASDIVGFMMN